MPNDDYFARDADPEAERARLGLFEHLLDPLTKRRLMDVGLAPGWRSLLLAAGRGTVARWVAQRVGPRGHVVATDRDVSLLRETKLPAVEIREHDIMRDSLELTSFDLVHCRCLLMHLGEPERALERMAAALKPGGWLLVEEPDDSAAGPTNAAHPDAERFAAANRQLLEGLRADRVMNPYLGRHLGDLLASLGLVNVQCEGQTWVHRGCDVAARLMLATLPLHERAGRYSQDDAEATRRALTDPAFTFVDTTWFGAHGQRAQPAPTNHSP